MWGEQREAKRDERRGRDRLRQFLSITHIKTPDRGITNINASIIKTSQEWNQKTENYATRLHHRCCRRVKKGHGLRDRRSNLLLTPYFRASGKPATNISRAKHFCRFDVRHSPAAAMINETESLVGQRDTSTNKRNPQTAATNPTIQTMIQDTRAEDEMRNIEFSTTCNCYRLYGHVQDLRPRFHITENWLPENSYRSEPRDTQQDARERKEVKGRCEGRRADKRKGERRRHMRMNYKWRVERRRGRRRDKATEGKMRGRDEVNVTRYRREKIKRWREEIT